MQPASSTQIPDGLLAAMTLLSENPRLGLKSKNPALRPGHNLPNFTAAIGDSWSVASESRWSHEMGRFLSPDWSDKPEAVPYADLENPQSLNLYGYAGNNPLRRTDPDGHCTVDGETHGGLWCFAHALGLVETQHEQANDLRTFYSGVIFTGSDGKTIDPSKLSDADIIQFNKDHRDEGAMTNWAMGAISVTNDKLQHIYDKHAGDFGLSGNKNSEQLQNLSQALDDHIKDPDTVMKPGQYRGQDADIYLNSRTNNVVVTDKSGNVIAGFKASPAQVGYINSTGRLN